MRRGRHARAAQAGAAGSILTLLFLANLLNYYDRAMPAVVIDEVRAEFHLDDTQIGAVASALTLVYAVAGIWLGRLADRRSRRAIMGWGLAAWSVFTAATGAAAGFLSLVLVRMGVGIGEASYAPAATSVIADLYPAEGRSRATATFMRGLPVGLMLAYFTVGPLTDAFGTWRVPFLLAAVPGLALAVRLSRIREPARGAAERAPVVQTTVDRPVKQLARVATFRWLALSFLGYNIAAYTVNTFTVPLLQRYFRLSLTAAATITGLVVGVTGLVGLTLGGRLADRATVRSTRERLRFGGACIAVAAPLTLLAFGAGEAPVGLFAAIFGLGWLVGYAFYTCCFPAVSDVVEPASRGTAMAILLAAGYLLGGAAGPLLVGVLSDGFAAHAMADAGADHLTRALRGEGLHDAMLLVVPISLAVAATAMVRASRTVVRDRERMLVRLSGGTATTGGHAA